MLRTKVDAQGTLWETLLPPEFLRLPPGLFEVDALLDDPVFFEPFEEFFDPEIGRPSIPIETYLRMMFLRFRYRLGFETLCAEVADSLAWRRFCRIPITDPVPHPTTLMKITTRCGQKAVAQLNEALLAKAEAAKVLKLDKVRADTTVVEANVAYPSDAGLLGKGVARLAKLVAKLKEAGHGSRTSFATGPARCARRSHEIGAWLRRRSDDAKEEVLAITAELVCGRPGIGQRSPGRGHKHPTLAAPGRRSGLGALEGAFSRARGDDHSARAGDRPDPDPRSEATPAGVYQGGLLARHRCPPHSQRTTGTPGRVRLQGTGTRQRRRNRGRPRGHDRKPTRRTAARTGHRSTSSSFSVGPPAPSPQIAAMAKPTSKRTFRPSA